MEHQNKPPKPGRPCTPYYIHSHAWHGAALHSIVRYSTASHTFTHARTAWLSSAFSLDDVFSSLPPYPSSPYTCTCVPTYTSRLFSDYFIAGFFGGGSFPRTKKATESYKTFLLLWKINLMTRFRLGGGSVSQRFIYGKCQ